MGTIVLGDVPDAPTSIVEKIIGINNISPNKLAV